MWLVNSFWNEVILFADGRVKYRGPALISTFRAQIPLYTALVYEVGTPSAFFADYPCPPTFVIHTEGRGIILRNAKESHPVQHEKWSTHKFPTAVNASIASRKNELS
jgi:hypothetical protein